MAVDTIDTTFGVAFVGLVISSILYGLTLMQTYVYFRTYPNDSYITKGLVFVLWLMDTLHLVLCMIVIYWYLITNFDNTPNLALNHWSINLQTDCNGIIGMLVELFFARRVWRVSKSRTLTAFITLLAFLHFSLGVYFTVQAFSLKEFAKYTQLTWVTSVGLGSAAAADISIAAALVYYLSQNRTGFEQTDSLIGTLMVYAINTGLLTSICASAAVITFATMPTNFVWLSFFFCLGKLYVNSLLASLNSRAALRARALSKEGTALNLSNLRSDGSLGSPLSNRRFSKAMQLPHHLQINVQTIKEQSSDFYSTPSSPIDPDRSPSIASSSNISKQPTPYTVAFSEREYERRSELRESYP